MKFKQGDIVQKVWPGGVTVFRVEHVMTMTSFSELTGLTASLSPVKVKDTYVDHASLGNRHDFLLRESGNG